MKSIDILTQPWPWYVSGPLIGLIVPSLLIIGNKQFGVSSTMKDICAICIPNRVAFFKYDLKEQWWNLIFVSGVVIGAFVVGQTIQNPNPIQLSNNTIDDLKLLGITSYQGLIPGEIFNWRNISSGQGFLFMVIGGFLVGFGVRYAGGCTSGHAIMGLSQGSLGSLISVIGFFVGGLIMTHLLFPLIFNL